jgi:hypothetical protein
MGKRKREIQGQKYVNISKCVPAAMFGFMEFCVRAGF